MKWIRVWEKSHLSQGGATGLKEGIFDMQFLDGSEFTEIFYKLMQLHEKMREKDKYSYFEIEVYDDDAFHYCSKFNFNDFSSGPEEKCEHCKEGDLNE